MLQRVFFRLTLPATPTVFPSPCLLLSSFLIDFLLAFNRILRSYAMYGMYGRPAVSWGNSFHLAKEAIEKSVNEHQQKQNSRIVNHVPRLVDLAAERLGEPLGGEFELTGRYSTRHIGATHLEVAQSFLSRISSWIAKSLSDPDSKDVEPGSTKDIDE
ncbi:hypothetical protein B0H14DRAFT_3888663, partial [Mycena olivaceomarginata]